jgi:UDP-N-acetylmuramoylalanine--D-glutamate ligase
MATLDLKQKTVTIIGAGRSGRAVADLVCRMNGKAKISESATPEEEDTDLLLWASRHQVEMEWGGHNQSFIEDSDEIVLSPGVRIDAEPVRWARERNIPVAGEIEFAARLCPVPIIAVTGSNGKTTVVNLIKNILEAAGRKACLCGNIGTPFSQYVLQLEGVDYVVLEISSFQLESIVRFRPHIAVFLNFSQNHLDRHKDIQEYFGAKKRIFLNQTPDDYAVLNYQDPAVRALASELKARVIYFNDPGTAFQNSTFNPNQLAAMTVAQIAGVPEHISKKVFEEFKGVEHRLEWVRSLDGVDFINDSKATTAEAGRWALSSIDKPIVMICGGKDKNIDFSVLKDLVQRKVKAMVVIGEAKEKLSKTFAATTDVVQCSSLKDAVVQAKRRAQPGDVVLFSPLCASFDMFTNFEERGKTFKEIVRDL